ncbi:hypothetical protein KVK94_00280 [Helicobacter pylori]|uniref:hypothetical protein n=1 Tax=Helicobacter pylori TaxID=210 RepID=UPI000EB1CC26|nr:hypothetical protein [Helicobacter pylori]RKV41787.1 hypothetical protein DD778_07055 [Helicobacter pylori]WQX84075.1 hypothetical protein KVK94_00280 [Helicobacter pylori]
MSGVHIVENTNNEKIEKPNISNPTASTPPPPNNEELLELVRDVRELKDRIKKLEDLKLEDFEPLRKPSHFIGNLFGKSSNDTQENPKDAQKKEEELKKVQEENTALNRDKTDLAREKDKLANKITGLSTDKENLTNQLNASQK